MEEGINDEVLPLNYREILGSSGEEWRLFFSQVHQLASFFDGGVVVSGAEPLMCKPDLAA